MARRLFIAVDLPEPVRRRLARLVADAPRGVRPVRSEQIHLTLHFLGDVDDAAIAPLATALASVTCPSFAIDLSGTGVFPPRGRPTVLWAGVAASRDLHGLHAAVTSLITASGFTPESRSWTPHVTLARFGPGVSRGWITDFLDRHRGLAEADVPISAVRLYESTRTPGGTVHTAIATARLMTSGQRRGGES